jgi:DNA (cytosine-5)-methyltransferase 1
MRVLDLFSGIGGFSLGLERAGMKTVAFCEIEPYCRAVLRKHWPDVPIYDDVRTLTAERLAADGIGVDLICGGFPCQDISTAGKGAGIEGERSGLWREYARLIGELRPRYVIVENVAALLGRGLGVVLGDLAAIGFDAEWHCIPASAIGAPHRRDRLWIVAHPNGSRTAQPARRKRKCGLGAVFGGEALANPGCRRRDRSQGGEVEQPRRAQAVGAGQIVADSHASDEQWRRCPLQMGWGRFASQALNHGGDGRAKWSSEPDVGRVAYGVPSRVDRLGGLGNAVVPDLPEHIGRAILAVEAAP